MEILDTNLFIDHFRGYAPATLFFESLENAMFSAVTETELVAGSQCSVSETKKDILKFLSKWEKINVDNQIALLAGDLSREYRKDGLELGDAIIAATAIINKAELLTRNVRDFEKIKTLRVKSPY